jgi:diketogulonate reductase-like aldo/keto reductase
VQQNIVIIPKSIKYEHLFENFNLFDFKLTDNDIIILNNLNKNKHFCWNSDLVF